MEAIIYSRESEEDRKGKDRTKDFITTSIRNQELDGRLVAEKRGDKIIRVFKDVNVQSTESNRKDFNNLIDYIKGRLVKIYIKDYTRLGRYTTFFELRDRLVKSGIKKQDIFFWNEPNSNGVNIEEDSIIMIKVTAYYMSIEKNRKEYLNLIDRKIKEQKPILNPPYGYKWKNKDWIVVDKKIINVLKIFQDFLDNVHYKDTCELLKIHKSLYYRILNNYKLYYGIIEYKIAEKDSFNKVIGQKQIKYECSYQKILTEELFNKINSKLQTR